MRLGVMCSGNGTNFENIITNPLCNKHEVVLMIHNTKQCGAVKRAAKWGIPHVRIPHKDEDKMIEMFKVWNVDLIILAGYMRVIKNPADLPAPIINVHPSLLPKYKGLNVVERAMEAGDEETGCTVHYVNEEIEPVSNRLLIFDGLFIHTGCTPSKNNRRILINSNFRYREL